MSGKRGNITPPFCGKYPVPYFFNFLYTWSPDHDWVFLSQNDPITQGTEGLTSPSSHMLLSSPSTYDLDFLCQFASAFAMALLPVVPSKAIRAIL